MNTTSILLGVGAGLLLAPLLVILAWKIFLWWLKRTLAKLASRLTPCVPTSITLQPLSQPTWANPEVEMNGRQLQACGFQALGAFSIPEMPEVLLSCWQHPQEQAFGVVYQHAQLGCWIDISSRYPNSSCTHTSAKNSGLDQHPDHPNHRCLGQSPQEVFRTHLQQRPDSPPDFDPQNFVEMFQEAYRRDREWRLTRGTSRQEMERVAGLSGQHLDAEGMEQAYLSHRAQERALLIGVLRERFLASTQLSAAQWVEAEPHLVFIHDALEEDELAELAWLSPTTSGTPRQRARNSSARYLGSLTEPLEVDVYRAPEPEEA